MMYHSHTLACCECRWEGRPRTPPFKWGETGEVLPPHDTWLHELDLKAEGLGALVDPDLVSCCSTSLVGWLVGWLMSWLKTS